MAIIYDSISGDVSAVESSGVFTPLSDTIPQSQSVSPVLDIGYTIKTDASAPYIPTTTSFNWWIIVLTLVLYYLYIKGR